MSYCTRCTPAASAAPAAIRALRDTESSVRVAAAYALAEIGTDALAAVRTLTVALRDPKPAVTTAVRDALAGYRDGHVLDQWWEPGYLTIALVGVGIRAATVGFTPRGTSGRNTHGQVAYIDGIVPHHQIAIMRADEALAKASRPGMITLAQRVKSDQTAEIAEFKATRIRLTGSDETPPPMMPQPIPPGPEFERMWATMMIAHHQGAIDMSRLALGAGVSFPLDTLARHAIQAQQREQQDLRDSIVVWYGTP